jgi:predicted Holliday junction resolvase-like endonuclease
MIAFSLFIFLLVILICVVRSKNSKIKELKAKIEAAPQRKKISRDPKAHFEKEQKTAVPAPINDESTKEDQ